MFVKVAIFCAAVLGVSNGVPVDHKASLDVSKFLAPRIVGGTQAAEGAARYMVALVYGRFFKSLVCGASIITSRHVLSAAHCIEPFVYWGQLSDQLQGAIGSNYWNSSNVINFSGFVNHPEWCWETIKNDIGVLITTEHIDFKKHEVVPIAINYDWVGGGIESRVYGWGRTGTWDNIPYRIHYLDVMILKPETCLKEMERAEQELGPVVPHDPHSEICTFHSLNHAMCFGDSGSPLVAEWGGVVQVTGIVSWGIPCGEGYPDFFTRVSAFKDFLTKVTV